MRRTHSAGKAIIIFCTSLEIGGEPITSEYYWQAYLDLLLALKERGVEAYFAAGNQTYRGNGYFSMAFTTDHRIASPAELKPVKNVQASLVFERSETEPFAGKDITVVNPESLRRIANNKIAIYRKFGDLQPYSVVAKTPAELLLAITEIEGDMVVVKEQEGYGGDAVYIGGKLEVFKQIPSNRYPLLVQEFLDTSIGVPGHGPGVHDVRLEICGGEITNYYIRYARPGSYHSNVNRGGQKTFLPVQEVPDDLLEAVAKIDKVFAPMPRFYAADFAYSADGWKLIELNDYVGFSWAKFGASGSNKEPNKSLSRLVDYLIASCSSAPTKLTSDLQTVQLGSSGN